MIPELTSKQLFDAYLRAHGLVEPDPVASGLTDLLMGDQIPDESREGFVLGYVLASYSGTDIDTVLAEFSETATKEGLSADLPLARGIAALKRGQHA